jgi:tetratricopeptide (TPR) repeat protein
MPKSAIFRTAFAVFAIAACILLSGCGSAADRDEAALKADSGAQDVLRRVNAESASQRNISAASFEELKKLIAKYPESPTLLKYYRSALIYRGDFKALADLLSKDGIPGSVEDRKTLAKAYVESGQYAKALELIGPLVAADPKNLEFRGLAGLSYLRVGDLDNAAQSFDAVWDQIIEKKMAPEISLRGIVYFRQNKLEKARETLELAASIDPGHITTNNTLSQVYRELGNDVKAEEFAKKAYDAQKRSVAQNREANSRVARKVLLEQAWKAEEFRKVVELSNQLLAETKNPAEEQRLFEYLYNAYKKLGMEKEASEILDRAKSVNR